MEEFFEEFTIVQSDSSLFIDSYIFPLKRKSPEKQSGYPIDRFENPPPLDFICFMCENVAKKPLECKKCGRLCCDECVYSRIVNQEDQSSRLFKCKMCNCMQEPRKPSQLLLRMIAELKVKCRNFESGCCSYISLDEYAKHEMTCPFTEVKCKNFQDCQIQGLIRNFFEVDGGMRGSHGSLNGRGRGKVYVCSERCKMLAGFENLIKDKKIDKAVEEYIRILKRDNI